MAVTLNAKYIENFADKKEIESLRTAAEQADAALRGKNGAGADFLGWLRLPFDYDKAEFARIKAAAAKIRADSDALVVVGIGGSYLGARAVIEFLGTQFFNESSPLKVYFVGNNLSGDYLNRVIDALQDKRFSVNVISKSGTTTESAVAFRVFKKLLEQRVGKKEAAGRIYATTDAARGTLKQLADAEGYETFVIPDDVGGRYSVLSAVGLLPVAAAGFDIDALMSGAAAACERYSHGADNDAATYAIIRNVMLRKGKAIELLSCYEPAFTMMCEWWKQLYGESEGKDGKGLFPASVSFTADLHSMGQFIQDGTRNLFETVVHFSKARSELFIEKSADNFDGLDFLAGQNLSAVNERAFEGTLLAHTEGGVPNVIIDVDGCGERELGELIYFFEYACGISGYILGVNPFNQPGVEAYKKNMFALLGKPGYEQQGEELRKKLK